MASFDFVNYSLRPSKSIQRSLVFEDVRRLQVAMGLQNLVYVGFGSIWFTDFLMAHRLLHIPRLISIEADEIGHARAEFNKPFANVTVVKGFASAVMPTLTAREELATRPWITWLDYDKELGEVIVEDIRFAISNLPADSVLVITVNSVGRKYGNPNQRQARIRALLGDVVPTANLLDNYQNDVLPSTLGSLCLDFMKSVAADVARLGGFVPAFKLPYQDGASMLTFGGILPSPEKLVLARNAVRSDSWLSLPDEPIIAPHLTAREAAVLQAKLPADVALDRDAVKALGFDLDENQIKVFERYYKFYPNFAQVVS